MILLVRVVLPPLVTLHGEATQRRENRVRTALEPRWNRIGTALETPPHPQRGFEPRDSARLNFPPRRRGAARAGR